VNIFITGHSGFIGKNICSILHNYNYVKYNRNNSVQINEDIVFHFAGKAHDTKNVSNSEDYYKVNTDLTKNIYDEFLNSSAKIFIMLSSVKAAADNLECVLTEDYSPCPLTHYGKSKLLAEQYILSKEIPYGKRVYILRPGMIHGADNRGNLNLLFKLISIGISWPLGSFENKRSYCNIQNLSFVIKQIIEKEEIPSGIYNLADDEAISTNRLIELIAISINKKVSIYKISKKLIIILAKLGDYFNLPFNSERLQKLTENYVVSNEKIVNAIGVKLPVSVEEGLLQTLKSFEK